MNKVNQNKSARSDGATEIVRLRHELRSVREQVNRLFDGFEQRLDAMLPKYEDQARYQRIRAICSDRAQIRAVLDGRVKI